MVKPGDVVILKHNDPNSECNAGLVYMIATMGPVVMFVHHSDKMNRIDLSYAAIPAKELRVIPDDSIVKKAVYDKVALIQRMKGYRRIVPKSVLEIILGRMVLDDEGIE